MLKTMRNVIITFEKDVGTTINIEYNIKYIFDTYFLNRINNKKLELRVITEMALLNDEFEKVFNTSNVFSRDNNKIVNIEYS